MDAAILAVGDELVFGLTPDANSCWLARRLAERGIVPRTHLTIGDQRTIIAHAIALLGAAHHLVIVTGGLGPTPDDVTREALGDVLATGEELVRDDAAVATLERWFARTGKPMPPANRKQALRPRLARMIPNKNGTAPGLIAERGSCRIVVLPGVPHEMRAMFDQNIEEVAPRGDQTVLMRSVHTIGIGESELAGRLHDLLELRGDVSSGTTSGGAGVSIRLYGCGPPDEIGRQLDGYIEEIEQRCHPYAFGRDEKTIAAALGEMLKSRGATIATAESCTGGLIGAMLTETPGSSAYYLGGWVTYSNDLKSRMIDVRAELIEKYGAVSAEAACAMAEGARRRSGADLALAVTGIAGPDGGDARKPVGTVFIASARRAHDDRLDTEVRHILFCGDRHRVRERAAATALQIARWRLLGIGEDIPLLWEVRARAETARKEPSIP